MADPIITPQLLAAAGAGIGALSKPRNPLQGALLGGIAGYTGGTALGLGAPTAASGGGLTMGAGGVTGLTSGTGAALNAGANTANAGLYSLGSGTTAGLSAVPASTSLIDPITMGQRKAFFSQAANINQPLVKPFAYIKGTNINTMASDAAQSIIPTQAANAPLNYSLVAPSAVTSPPSTSFMDKISMSGKNAIENPMQSFTALNATNSLLQQEQMPQSAPVPLQAGRGVKPYDFVAAMDPYRQSVISNQPISLLG